MAKEPEQHSHREWAEILLERANNITGPAPELRASLYARAQVHATLALIEVTEAKNNA